MFNSDPSVESMETLWIKLWNKITSNNVGNTYNETWFQLSAPFAFKMKTDCFVQQFTD